ncbi:hypothetical protein [Arthrobacter sp. B6]|uniref:hypothetical protein n=1 Tax=Arthrobacter sp. B6 TaxID=1570137 RepID=UPI000836EED5|nr:hypothetical protein [Arthrobacter sp. B6]
MKKRSLVALSGYGAGAASLTGHHCPQTGLWLADEDPRPKFVSRGDVMPAVNGRPTHWTLSTEADLQSGQFHVER